MRLDRRVPEPELMEDPDQARAYADADFTVAHGRVVADLAARHPALARVEGLAVIDLGCGPADVTVRLARALPRATLMGIDAGPRMLALARARIAREGLEHRVGLVRTRVDGAPPTGLGPYGLIASNSLLHHMADPLDLWRAVRSFAAPGAAVHVVDLRRPLDTGEVDTLVHRETADEHPLLQEDFRRSLMAAYRPAEVEAQLEALGLDAHLRVEVLSDRHLVAWGRLPD